MTNGKIHLVLRIPLLLASLTCVLPADEVKFIDILDKDKKATGISYRILATSFENTYGQDAVDQLAQNMQTPIEIRNTTAAARRVIVCMTGKTKDLDGGPYKHLQINMKLAGGNQITCELPHDQGLPAVNYRLGAMGCQLFNVPACTTQRYYFTSGNDRTIPVFGQDGKPVAGKFKVIGNDYGGVGPTQWGALDERLLGAGNLVGGHPPVFTKTTKERMKIVDVLDTVNLQFILLDDPALGLVKDQTPEPPDPRTKTAKKNGDTVGFWPTPPLPQPRKDASFNCNKCFGMAPSTGDTGLNGFFGYQLNGLGADDRKNLKAIFAEHAVDYRSLELKEARTLSGNINLSSDETYFASAGTVPVTLDVVVNNLPASCTLSNVNPAPGQIVYLSPQDARTGTFSVSCSSTDLTGADATLTASVTRLDTSPPSLLTQTILRLIKPAMCDVNLDGVVDLNDINEITGLRGTPAAPDDRYDVDHDGTITTNDARVCVLKCTNALCAVPAVNPNACK